MTVDEAVVVMTGKVDRILTHWRDGAIEKMITSGVDAATAADLLADYDADVRQWRAATLADLSTQLRHVAATPW